MSNEGYTDETTDLPAAKIVCEAGESLCLFAVDALTVPLLRSLLQRTRAGLAAELLVPARYFGRTGLTDRYLTRFTAAGGRFFRIDMQPDDWRRIRITPRSFLLADDQTLWLPTGDSGHWRRNPEGLVSARQQVNLLRVVGEMAAEKLHEVAPASTRLRVETDRRLRLHYYLTAADPLGEEAPRRLIVRPDLPGFFGVLHGVSVTLHWVADNAQELLVNGETVPAAGERTFVPDGKTKLFLAAVGVMGENWKETVVINTFRPPVMPEIIVRPVSGPPRQQENTNPTPTLRGWLKNLVR